VVEEVNPKIPQKELK